MIKIKTRQHFGRYQVVDSTIERDINYSKSVLCYCNISDNMKYITVNELKIGREELNKRSRDYYHKGKPVTLEYHKMKNKEFYQNNKKYRENKITQMNEYYHDNPEYFKAHRQSEKTQAQIKERAKTPEYKAYMKQYRKENKEKIRKKNKEYYQNNPEIRRANYEKHRLNIINNNRVNKGLEPARDIETHFQQRKQDWFKKIWFSHLYNKSK